MTGWTEISINQNHLIVALTGRNHDWRHLYNRDIISLPDAWEYPWYAAWDSAFHMIPMARVDPAYAKEQLILFLREWYMHPNGQIPAYEFAFDDVNPPVHAWACWQVYKRTGRKDRTFLARCFHKLSLNFTWWINRKDPDGHNLFAGGFLGLDNIGIFDRSKPLPGGGQLRQADGTAWMGFFCAHMLTIALELAKDDGQGNPDPSYGDMASKYFEHFIAIIDALNNAGGDGLWDEEDGFYYDQLLRDGEVTALRSRSLVGLNAVDCLCLFQGRRPEKRCLVFTSACNGLNATNPNSPAISNAGSMTKVVPSSCSRRFPTSA